MLLLQGRAHYYETGDAAAMQVPIGVVAALGAPPLLLTNAAGSIKLDLRPSSLVAITDHINLSGSNPLIGDRSDARFVNLTGAYDERLRKKLKLAATAAGISLHEGVYMWFSGPSFETPAEIRMAKTLGADLVGMSTVPEVILARYFGLKVAARLGRHQHGGRHCRRGALACRDQGRRPPARGAGLRRLIRGLRLEDRRCLTPRLARRILRCLDLTDLSDSCSEPALDALCRKALTPHGPVAAVCVWPQLVGRARDASATARPCASRRW